MSDILNMASHGNKKLDRNNRRLLLPTEPETPSEFCSNTLEINWHILRNARADGFAKSCTAMNLFSLLISPFTLRISGQHDGIITQAVLSPASSFSRTAQFHSPGPSFFRWHPVSLARTQCLPPAPNQDTDNVQ